MSRTRMTDRVAGYESTREKGQVIKKLEDYLGPDGKPFFKGPSDPYLKKIQEAIDKDGVARFGHQIFEKVKDGILCYEHGAPNSVTARLDVIAGELEAVDPRLALALDQVSDRLEMAKEEESFSTKIWKHLDPIVTKNIKQFHDKANKLDQAIRSEDIWDTLDKAVKAHGEDFVQDKLDQNCKEWNNLFDPDYISADTWLEDINKLNSWIKKTF